MSRKFAMCLVLATLAYAGAATAQAPSPPPAVPGAGAVK